MTRARPEGGSELQHPTNKKNSTTTRTRRRMNPTRRTESVCRSLFGPVDREQLRRDLTQRLQEITEQDSRRWNFNFHTDTPMCGRFQWEEIPADCAAAVYQESARPAEELCSPRTEGEDRLSAGADQENCSSISNTQTCPVRRKRTLPKSAAKPRRNAMITDFFAKRRRTTETKSILNTLHTSEAASCKTIR